MKISVIIPVYNQEKYLDKCLESVVNQTFKDYEIIIINDGSIDNSKNIISKYQKKYHNIIFIDNYNHGIGYTRNIGIEKSNGEYIIFIDSDDYIKKDMLEKMYNFASKNNLDIAVCDYYDVIENKNIINEYKIDDFEICNPKYNPNVLYYINHSPWNKIYSKKLLNDYSNIRFLENLKYEDLAFVVPIISKAKKIGKLNECLYYYVKHNNSETTITDKRVFDIFKSFDKLFELIDLTIYKNVAEKIIVSKIAIYNIQQRNQNNTILRNKFVNKSFDYLETNIPNYKKNSYFKERSTIKSILEKNKFLTKIYINLYYLIKKR